MLQDKVIHVNSLEGDVYISPLVNICCVADTPPKSKIGDNASNATRVVYFYSSSDGLSPSHSDYIANTVIDKYTVW